MVFISTIKPLDELLKENVSCRFNNLDWFLFDSNIKNKSLKNQSTMFGGGNGNLSAYMDRIKWYPIWYKETLYCYLMSNDFYYSLNLFENTNTACVWNMKRVPEYLGCEERYPRIPEHEMIFNPSNSEYLVEKFMELIKSNLKVKTISEICIGG